MSRLFVVPVCCSLIASLVLSLSVGHVTAQEPAAQASASKEVTQATQGSEAKGSDSKAAAGSATPVVPTATVEEEQDPKMLATKASYILGFNTAKKMVTDLTRQGIDVDQDRMLAGIQDAMGGAQSKYSPEEVKSILTAYQKLLQKQQMEKMEKEGAENRKAGEAYQATFGKKEGVKPLENGIQYEVLKAGEGEALDPAGKVMVHYTGKFTDGTVFDSSMKRGRPVPMSVSGVGLIPAFGKVLPKMKMGGKWRVCIPSEQAYGVRGSGRNGSIGPNETLVFDIEVVEKVEARGKKKVTPRKKVEVPVK